MSSWEDIANEVAPVGFKPRGLATGAHRLAKLDTQAEKEFEAMQLCDMALLPAPVSPRVIFAPPCLPETPLSIALRGLEMENYAGKYFRITRPAKEFNDIFDNLHELLGEVMPFVQMKSRTKNTARDLMFLDIETTGLSSSAPLLLIGMYYDNGHGAQLDLILARSFAEERAALAAFAPLVEDKTLITFNGRHFDWPYIERRCLRHAVNIARPRAHLDLLLHSRRKWKKVLPNCRLQTLEYYVCGRRREGDISSSRIPAQYQEFVSHYGTTDRGAHLLAPIIHHNAWDVLTMADLLRRFDKPIH